MELVGREVGFVVCTCSWFAIMERLDYQGFATCRICGLRSWWMRIGSIVPRLGVRLKLTLDSEFGRLGECRMVGCGYFRLKVILIDLMKFQGEKFLVDVWGRGGSEVVDSEVVLWWDKEIG